MDRSTIINEIKEVVIKVGTNCLSNPDGSIDNKQIQNFSKSISKLHSENKNIVLVTSGAIGTGMSLLDIKYKPRSIELRQACAAVGQNLIMNMWSDALKKYNIKVAQVLLTYDVFNNRKSYLNLKNTLNKLLKLKIIPIINENDVIATDEIGTVFGDNDKMSALLASKGGSDILLMITDVDGLYSENPKMNPNAKLIETVYDVNDDIKRVCRGKGCHTSTGGMKTKIEAARLATDAGVTTFIINGKKRTALRDFTQGKKIGTMFLSKKKLNSKKNWLKITTASGDIEIDDGAKRALVNGKNLLSAGICSVHGHFVMNDIVNIKCNNEIIGKGIIDYSSDELVKIAKKSTTESKRILGRNVRNIFRRDNIVILR